MSCSGKHHQQRNFWGKVFFITGGFLSLLWLLLRSGKKPSRISYPCQKVALSNSLALFAWLASIISGHFIYKKIHNFKRVVFVLPLIFLLFSTGIISWRIWQQFNTPQPIWGQTTKSKVIWVTDNRAAKGWNANNWENKADELIVQQMMDEGIKALTGQSSVNLAWTNIFTQHNSDHHDYLPGEKIAIKINNNNNYSSPTSNNCYSSTYGSSHCPLTQTIKALLNQLIKQKGIPEQNIIVYDTSRGILDYQHTAIKNTYPNVILDTSGWNYTDTVFNSPTSQVLKDATYLINMPLLRTHSSTGMYVTLSFKNHYGEISNVNAFHQNPTSLDPQVNPLVALSNFSYIKNKTILIVDDAIYGLKSGGPSGNPDSNQGIKPYPNSLFMSSDSVAIDSVMIDYLSSIMGPYDNFNPSAIVYPSVAASIGLGNYATSCTKKIDNTYHCSFSYPNINLIKCDQTCSASISPTPTLTPSSTPAPTSTPTPTQGVPTGTPPPSPTPTPSCPLAKQGDVNCDNSVNILDLVTVLSNFGRNGTGVAGDINGDGTVNILDLVTLLSNFGRSGGTSPSPSPVPSINPKTTPTTVPQPPPVDTPNPTPDDKPGWKLTFSDEFNGPSLNTTKWNTRYRWCTPINNELQSYVADAFVFENGILKIKADKKTADYCGQTMSYTSGLINTGDPPPDPNPALYKFAQRNGYFEARLKMPKGRGFWPAFWLWADNYDSVYSGGEIDIMEFLGQEPNKVYFSNHLNTYHSTSSYTGPTSDYFTTDFHTFAAEWDAQKIIWYVDGVERKRNTQGVPQGPLYLIANLAVGGNWPGAPDATTPFPSYYEIDYIRVYQKAGTVTPSPTPYNDILPAGKNWSLVWSDEFNGTTLDLSKWAYRLGPRRDGIWVAEDAYLDGNGNLVIRTKFDGTNYTSGAVYTNGKFEHRYGYWVTRCKLPSQVGHWSAFWIQSPTMGNPIGNPATAGAEIDVMEYPTRTNKVQHAVHWDGYGADHKQNYVSVPFSGSPSDYHTFGLEWTPTEYVFYVDGVETWRNSAAVSQRTEYLELTDEVGTWAGRIQDANLPDYFICDYVRVYDAL